jgi:hypothetical protein
MPGSATCACGTPVGLVLRQRDRAYQQPLDLVTLLVEGASLCVEAAAQTDDAADLLRRLKACRAAHSCPDTAAGWIPTTCIALRAQDLWLRDPPWQRG